MNTAWGTLWSALRSLSLGTATGLDADELQRQAGLPYLGWPTNTDAWLVACNAVAFGRRGTRPVLVQFLADALVAWSETITVTGYAPATVGGSPRIGGGGLTDAHQNRIIRTTLGTFFTGHIDGDGYLTLPNMGLWLDDPAAVWAGVPTTTFDVEFTAFVVNTPGPGMEEPGYGLSGAYLDPVFKSKGYPCVVEIVLVGAFLDTQPPWPYLFEGAETYPAGTWGSLLYEAGEDDPDLRGLYLVDEDFVVAAPDLTRVIDRSMLAAGVQPRILIGLAFNSPPELAPPGD